MGLASLRRQFSFSRQSFGNSQSSGTYGSFKTLSLPNNPTSWEVLIRRCWLPLGIPQSIFVCVNRCAVIFTQQLPTLDFFHPESFARDLNSVLTNHPGRKRRGSGFRKKFYTTKTLGGVSPGVRSSRGRCLKALQSVGFGFFAAGKCSSNMRGMLQPANTTLCLASCSC